MFIFLFSFLIYKNKKTASADNKIYGKAIKYKIPEFNPLAILLPPCIEDSATTLHMEH
ncbi:hypothetical protein JBKA6_0608 [Ichthyobacterium seriolicida]|uniref:Uncharacterized protein n=1 Tax=Ichthyobacterium seriolicida TaxID=242600 RepID=A0A1J1E102_9FLAO|nr:hypothetical protein JBKA6_0608 [Ichthyobacterium seriolicida]